MKVVITGGAGFIGANLCAALATQPSMDVVAYDNLSTGSRSNLDAHPTVFLVEADILNSAELDKAFAGADSVVHLAARPSVPRSLVDPLASHHANSTGTVLVLEAARANEVKQVIIASSSSVYGSNPSLPKHESMRPSPLSPYAASKLAAESYSLAWQHSFGLPTLAFRFFNVFGPMQTARHAYAAVIPAFIDAALGGKPIPVHGDGTQTRDFTYVGSVVAILEDAIRRHLSHPDPVNLAFGTRTSLLDVIARLEGILDRELELRHLPRRDGDVRDSQADNGEMQLLFPGATPIDLNEGLRSTVDWFRASGAVLQN